jgi:hypothetical protein
VILHEEKPTEK